MKVNSEAGTPPPARPPLDRSSSRHDPREKKPVEPGKPDERDKVFAASCAGEDHGEAHPSSLAPASDPGRAAEPPGAFYQSHEVKEASRADEAVGLERHLLGEASNQLEEAKSLQEEEFVAQKAVNEAEEHEKKVAACQSELAELEQRGQQIDRQVQGARQTVTAVEGKVAEVERRLSNKSLSGKARARLQSQLAVANLELVGARARLAEEEATAKKVRAVQEERTTFLAQLKSQSPTHLAFLKVQADFATFRCKGKPVEAAESQLKQREAEQERSALVDHQSLRSIGQNLEHMQPGRLRHTWPDLVESGLPRTEVERRLQALRQKMKALLPLHSHWDSMHRVLGAPGPIGHPEGAQRGGG